MKFINIELLINIKFKEICNYINSLSIIDKKNVFNNMIV